MTTIITPEEIQTFRTVLGGLPLALKALDELEDCEGDLQDAAISLGIRAGQQPQQDNEAWLKSLAKRCRVAICQEIVQENIKSGALDKAVVAIANLDLIPPILALPVVLYVLKEGLEPFCEPLKEKLDQEH